MAKREFSHLAKFLMLIEAGLILPFVYCVSFCSFRRIRRIADGVGALIVKISPAKKEEVRENLAVIFPAKIWDESELSKIAAQSQGYILRIFIELQKMSRMGIQDLLACLRLEDAQIFSRMCRLGREKIPQVFLTMHAGNWEFSGIVTRLLGFEMVSVVERQFNPYLDAYYQRLRRKAGIEVVYNEISLMRPLLKSLKAGKCAALVADQNYWHDPVFLPFFGKEASAPKGAGGLVVHTGAAPIVGASQRVGDGVYRIFVRLIPPPLISGNKEADILAFTRRAYAFYEEVIRMDPANWFPLSSPRWRLNRKTWKEWAENPDSSQF